MRRKLLGAVLVFAAIAVHAQYVPNNSQGFQFMPLFNPAFTGIEPFNDAKMSYRYQWAGFGANAPQFFNVGYQTRIKQPLDLSYNSLRLSGSANRRMQNIPPAKRMIHALGFNIFHSSIGVLKSAGGSLGYAVHYPVSQYASVAIGATALIENRKLDVASVTVRDPDEFYDYLLRSSTSQTDVNLRFGVLYYGDMFYIGASYLPVVNFALQSSDLAMEEPFYRGSIQGGVSLAITEEVQVKPSILALVTMQNKFVIDYNVKAYFQDKVWLGLGYRDIESGLLLLGFNINERFTVSYSYEMAVGKFRTFEDGSHELVLAARFNNLKRFNQYLW